MIRPMRCLMNPRNAATVILVLVGACASPTDLPDRDPTEIGIVVSVSATTVHIKAPSVTCGIIFTMDGDTRVLVAREDGTIVEADRSQVTVGRSAYGWASGPIAESCPAQAEAAVILLDYANAPGG
jgi:hypothetical protein